MTNQEVIGQPEGDSGRHWFVQESGENARQLLIYADQMELTDDKSLRFYNADGTLFMEFPPGWWTNIEFGQQ
jgi:hypothetical protein